MPLIKNVFGLIFNLLSKDNFADISKSELSSIFLILARSNPTRDEIILISGYLEVPLVLILNSVIFSIPPRFIITELYRISKFKIFPLLIKKLIFLSFSDLHVYCISVDKFLIWKSLFIFNVASKIFPLIL